ncbi:MAG: PHP domain-containing protein [Kiritimatiellae bacterium]|nr:PHP domain-containing protein [Kiritimatiellia bacterium]
MIDLHVHSTFSDGSFTPEELVAQAVDAGVSVLSLTDHDTTDGVARFLKACRASEGRVAGIPGLELSVQHGRRTVHMLGYFVDSHEAGLQAMLCRVRAGRHERNLEMIKKLQALDVAIDFELVSQAAGGDVIGRPHFAAVLRDMGVVQSTKEAFERFLARGRAGYAERYRPEPEEGIAAIRGAGGVAILAHPGGLQLGKRGLRILLAPMVEAGLEGIEVHYSEHSAQHRRRFAALAAEFDLIETGGSDFHGSSNPKLRLGRGYGSLAVPESVVSDLVARAGVAWPQP